MNYIASTKIPQRYAVTKLLTDMPTLYLAAEEPARFTEKRALALRFQSRERATAAATVLRGGRPYARCVGPYRVISIEPLATATKETA